MSALLPFASLALASCASAAVAEPTVIAELPVETVAVATEPPAAEVVATEVAQATATSADWADVLSAFVTGDGGFRYEALRADEARLAGLDRYLAAVASADVSGESRDAQLAFYINAYNAYTVKSVIELWPVESVLQEDGFFDGRTHTIAGRELTLNALENDIIRGEFHEPRIHFLVNCASASCPWLVGEVVTAENLEGLLEQQAQSYVRRTTQLDTSAGTIGVSQIFEWFAGDFEASGGVRAFLAAHVEPANADFVRDEAHAITFWPYDWATNAR
ncbi:MAG: DUF547 domain-containing protein [Myxococcales bacterium]|nr:DUF547 domain-containing protein [Myxococcales bacterium]MCB9530361.1 DUF547 domain-containing protein [Myxococcales bacterium]